MLAVQIVEILWTKATRGAPRSNERPALPRAFPLNIDFAGYAVQHFRLAEWKNSFSPELIKVATSSSVPASEAELQIQVNPDGSFRLGFVGASDGGQPKRRAISEVFTLFAGQYACIVVNARHTTHSGQYYSETTYNVTCGTTVAAERFLLGHPEHELNLKAWLF